MERKEFLQYLGFGTLGLALTPAAAISLSRRPCDSSSCQLAWEELCGKIGEVYSTDAFRYQHPVKKQPNVLLYGDSVSIKYTSVVQKSLEGKATVTRLFKNGGSSHNFIPNMHKMTQTMFQPHLKHGWNFTWDVIHFNVGLHDLKYLKGKHLNKRGKQVSSISEYKKNLKDICTYLKTEYPKAKLIFATTTPVPENAKGRYAGDSVKYNQAAKEVLLSFPDIVINDLYSFTLPQHAAWAQGPGDVHYNEDGFTHQGKEVARIITKYL